MEKHRSGNLWYCLLIAAACFLVFGRGLHYEFLYCWDDDLYVSANTNLGMNWFDLLYWWIHPMEGLLTPLTVNSLAVDAWIWGNTDPFGYHLTNIVLHILSAWTLFSIGRKEKIPAGILCGAVLLWALHVQRAESVVWITERKDVLSGLLVLLAWRCLLDRNAVRGCVLTSLFGVLAVLAKPSMAGAAVLYAVVGFLRRKEGESWKHVLLRTGIPAVLAVLFMLPAYLMTEQCGPGIFADPLRPLLVLIHNVCWYVESAFFPLEANPMYPRVVSCIRPLFRSLAAAMLVLAAGCRVYGSVGKWFRRYWPWMLVWGAFFAPTCGVRVFSNTDYCDRYNYFPCLILFFCLAEMGRDAVCRRPDWEKKIVLAALVLAALSGIRTACYLPVWKNSETLFKYGMYSFDRPNLKAVEGLGSVGQRLNRPDLLLQAGTCFLRMAETAKEDPLPEAFKPVEGWRDTGNFYLGLAAYFQRDYLTAGKYWEPLIRRPSFHLYNVEVYAPIMLGGYAEICLRMGRKKEAALALKRQLCYHRKGDLAWFRAQSVLAWVQGKDGEAASYLRQGLTKFPDDRWMKLRLEMLTRQKACPAGKKNTARGATPRVR